MEDNQSTVRDNAKGCATVKDRPMLQPKVTITTPRKK